jgi:hypothetical protein
MVPCRRQIPSGITKEQLQDIARKAAAARWGKKQ